MGLKSGSRDAGLDDADEENRTTEQEASRGDDRGEDEVGSEGNTKESAEPATESDATGEQAETRSDSESTESRPTMDSIPYTLRRNKVNEGREQVPYFLREEVIDAEDELHDTLEELLGENVYKSDYREAAMVVAQRNPELVAAVLREWGYDLDAM